MHIYDDLDVGATYGIGSVAPQQQQQLVERVYAKEIIDAQRIAIESVIGRGKCV